MDRFINKCAVAIALALLTACGMPSNEDVGSEFKNANPSYTVISVDTGEGDSDNVYFHIKYKKPNDVNKYEEVWLYQDSDLGWRNTNRILED